MNRDQVFAELSKAISRATTGSLSRPFNVIDRDLAEIQRTYEAKLTQIGDQAGTYYVRRAVANSRFLHASLVELPVEEVTRFYDAFKVVGFADDLDECMATIMLGRNLIEHKRDAEAAKLLNGLRQKACCAKCQELDQTLTELLQQVEPGGGGS